MNNLDIITCGLNNMPIVEYTNIPLNEMREEDVVRVFIAEMGVTQPKN